jgi:hypothetical protein
MAITYSSPVYIRLFNGLRDFDNPPDDWGFDGPIPGPFESVHVWGDRLLVCDDGGPHLVNLHVYYDGVFYGDWEVFSPAAPLAEAEKYDAALAGERTEGNFIFFEPLRRPTAGSPGLEETD